jgi:hypothetical protein
MEQEVTDGHEAKERQAAEGAPERARQADDAARRDALHVLLTDLESDIRYGIP